jgi:hypothetical protein
MELLGFEEEIGVNLGRQLSVDEVLAFASCEQLVREAYALGEHQPFNHNYYDAFTEDYVWIMDFLDPSSPQFRIEGREALKQFIDAQTEMPELRLHAMMNSVWKLVSPDLAQRRSYSAYYEFVPDHGVEAARPVTFLDAIERFRLEEGVWRVCHRHYKYLYGPWRPGDAGPGHYEETSD